jgi:hypothetical protein
METSVSKRFTAELAQILLRQTNDVRSLMSRIGIMALCLVASASAAAQSAPSVPQPGPDALKCAALVELSLEDASGGPALVTSAHLVDVSPSGLDQAIAVPSGYGITSPQLTAGAAILLSRAAMPQPREMEGTIALWASTHLGGQRSRIAGGHWLAKQSRDHADHARCQSYHHILLRQADQVLLHGWQLERRASRPPGAVHKSVLAYCGGQAGANEGLVTDPPSCKWQPEIIACASGSSGPDCLNEAQVSAIKHLMAGTTLELQRPATHRGLPTWAVLEIFSRRENKGDHRSSQIRFRSRSVDSG